MEITNEKLTVIVVLALLAVFVFPTQIQSFIGGVSGGLGMSQGAMLYEGEEPPEQETIGIEKELKESEAGETIILALASVNMKPTVSDMLNESLELINPTWYTWRQGHTEPTSVTLTSGTGTLAVAPKEIMRWAAGTDATYYWEQGPVTAGMVDTPIEVKLYSVCGASGATIKVFDTSYNDLSAGASNMTLGAGQDANLQIQIDVTEEYVAIKRPHICVAYNDTITNKITVSGLNEVDAPTRIQSTLDQCFDTGLEYYTTGDSILLYSATLDTVAGQDPTVAASATNWYVLDKDIWYKDGAEHFVNPVTNADLGSTTEWTTATYFA